MKKNLALETLAVWLVLLAAGAFAQSANQMVPSGTEIKVRTDTAIPAKLG